VNLATLPPDLEKIPNRPGLKTELCVGIILGLVGLLLNRLDVELLPGISLIFGSIFSLFALLRYGVIAGLTATLLAASATLSLYGHAWNLLLSLIELLVVTWLLRQRHLEPILAMLCYWLLVGWLLCLSFHYYFVEISWDDARLITLKQAVNGTFNMMVAQVICLMSQRLLGYKPAPVRIHTLLFNIIGLAAVVPIIIHMVIDIKTSYRSAVQGLEHDVEHAETLTVSLLREWLSERKLAVQAASRLIGLTHKHSTVQMRTLMSEVVEGEGPITRLLLLDAEHRVFALGVRSGIRSEVAVGQDMSRLAFVSMLKKQKETQITDLFNGKGGTGQPRLAAVVPVWRHGRYQQGVVATFAIDLLRGMLLEVAGQHQVMITLLDGAGLVIASTRPELGVMDRYRKDTGQVWERPNSRVRLITPYNQPVPLLAVRQALYVSSTALAAGSGWSVVTEAPVQPTVSKAVIMATRTLGLLSAMILLFVTASWLVALRLSRPLSTLEQATQQVLHDGSGQLSGLPCSSAITEINDLMQHLKSMFAELQRRHSALQLLNEQLEEQVESRTSRLQALMQEQQVILDNASVGIALMIERKVAWINHRLYELLQYPLEEVQDDIRVLYPSLEEYDRIGHAAYPVLERGSVYRNELQMVRRDGVLIWIRMHGKAIDPGNLKLGNIWTFEDINERKQAEFELVRLKEHLQEQVTLRTAELLDSHERLKELSSHLTTVRESERLTVAREIHDVLGAALTAINFDIAWLGRHYGNTNPTVDKRLAQMEETVQQAVAAIRRIVAELRPCLLDELGLAATMQWYLEQLKERIGMAIDLSIDASVHENCPLVRDYAVNIYRIFQEAITNVVRHAAASEVTVQLRCTGFALRLQITDNGRGIDQESLQNRQSFGIAGMRERARIMVACLQISPLSGGGTSVELSVPLTGNVVCPYAISP